MKTLNPYFRSASLLYNRLSWDINPLSWVSRNRLNQYKNSRNGKSCIILCNGPSLLDVDFNLLESSKTSVFGLNKINLLFDKVSFRPSFIVAVNKFVIEQNQDFYNKTNIPLFLDSQALKLGIRFRKNLNLLHSANFRGEFARNCSMSINQGFTVTYSAMQLAFHMGFRKVGLVGCDHNFDAKGTPNSVGIADKPDKNHFDPSYFSGGVNWHLPDLAQSEFHYMKAKSIFEEADGKIVNCTAGGNLEVFHRQSLGSFLSDRI